MTAEQQGMLLDLTGAWVGIVGPGAARAPGGDQGGAWGRRTSPGGAGRPGRAAFFRVQGPTVWIEYVPQGTDHIHTVVRNPDDDHGAGLLRPKE